MNEPQHSPQGTAIATGLILAGLMDLLVKKEVLTIPEVRSVLETAMTELSPRKFVQGADASKVITDLLQRFPVRSD